MSPPPDLSDRAADVLGLFLECRTQVRASFGGAIGIDRVAVRLVGEDFGITFDGDFWTLFGVVESEWLECMREAESKSAEGSDRGD